MVVSVGYCTLMASLARLMRFQCDANGMFCASTLPLQLGTSESTGANYSQPRIQCKVFQNVLKFLVLKISLLSRVFAYLFYVIVIFSISKWSDDIRLCSYSTNSLIKNKTNIQIGKYYTFSKFDLNLFIILCIQVTE